MFSLDMTGEDTAKTGGTFLIEKQADPSAVWPRPSDPHSAWGASEVKAEELKGSLLERRAPGDLPAPGEGHGLDREDESVRRGQRSHRVQERGHPVAARTGTSRIASTTPTWIAPTRRAPAEMVNVGVAIATSAWFLASATEQDALCDRGSDRAAAPRGSPLEKTQNATPEILAAWRKWYGEALDSPCGGSASRAVRGGGSRRRIRPLTRAGQTRGRGGTAHRSARRSAASRSSGLRVLQHRVAWVESRNISAAPIRRIFGRTRLDDPNTRVPEAMTETAWRLAATLTSDEALGIHLAESLPRGALDLIEYALRSSRSLESGLDRLARYGRLVSDRVATRTHRNEESLLFLVHDTGTTPLHPARTEFALAVALKLARDSTGTDITPTRVSFAHSKPDNTEEHRRFFHERVQFAAGATSMSLSAADGARPMCEADAALVGHYSAAAGERSGRSRPGESGCYEHTHPTPFFERLGQSVLTLDDVATALAVSRRTLTRRLTEEHASSARFSTMCEVISRGRYFRIEA